jgi:hypothetical protein
MYLQVTIIKIIIIIIIIWKLLFITTRAPCC